MTDGPEFTTQSFTSPGFDPSGYEHELPPPLPPPPPRTDRKPIIIAIGAVLVLLVVAVVGWIVWSRTSGVEGSATADSLASDMPSLSPTSGGKSVSLPRGAEPCEAVTGPMGEFTHSARGNSVTSCPFAEEARIAYARSGPSSDTPRTVTVYSPITKQLYDMSCRVTGPGPLVTCAGGNEAMVYLY